MNINSELVQQGVTSTTNGPRRSSRQARLRNRQSMSTGGSVRVRPSSSKQPAATPLKPSTDLFEDSVQEELPAIIINQWKPPASQSRVKKDYPRRCTFCRSRRQGPDSCQACRQRGLECRDWREASKKNNLEGRQKGNEGDDKSTRERRPPTRLSAPQQSDIKEALLQSFRAGPPVTETSQRHPLNLSEQLRGSVGREANQQDAAKVTTGLDLSERHTDTSHSKIRRVAFDTPSGRYLLPSPEVAEVDADVEMTTTQNPAAERASSFEIMTEAEYQASLKSRSQHSTVMTFKKEPADGDRNIGPRVDNVGSFLQSLGLDHWISNFHDVGLKSREHLKKMVNRVNDKERMEELWKLLQSQKIPIIVWWEVLDGLSKVAANHHL